MQSVAIIADSHDWHSQQIESSLKKRGCRVIKLKFNELQANFQRGKFFLNPELKKIKGVWLRFINNGTLEEITTKLTFLHLLEKVGVYIHNSPKTIEMTVDKVRTTGLLQIASINSPNTLVKIGKIKKFRKNNYLLKPIFGSQGKNIAFVKNKSNLSKNKPVGNVSYLQDFIGDLNQKKHWDVRVLVSNHKHVTSMKRSSKKILTNAYQGAVIEKFAITDEVKKMCIEVSKLFKLGYGGIDIKKNKGKYYILEVNSIPSWKAIQKITKKNITEVLVSDFLKVLKYK